MFGLLKTLAKQPWWLVVLLVGAALAILPTIALDRNDKGFAFTTHPPTTFVPVAVGMLLLAVSFAGVWWAQRERSREARFGGGLDLSRVIERDGVLSTLVAECEIRVVNGRIEQYSQDSGAVVLPCNEYFDDRCVDDRKSALGSYANVTFEGQVPTFVSLMKDEAVRRFGQGVERRKTPDESAFSFGVGRCLLLRKPLGRSTAVALVSTTTQRAGEGLASRISYLFEGMRELVGQLADARISEVVMPLMGAGHGRIEKPLALVGLLLALAEVAHYGQGSQRLRRVTVVVFRTDLQSDPEVDPVVVRRALALIGD
jgi:hypothetical protein